MTSGIPLFRLFSAARILPIDLRRVLLVHTDLPRAPQVPPHNRIRQQFFLERNAELERQVHIQHGNIERGGMIDRVDVGLRSVDRVQPGHFRGRGNRLHDQLGPEAREAMQDAALVSEQRYRNGNDSEDDGVGPDKRIEDEIRPQPAGPPVAPGNGCRRGLRPGWTPQPVPSRRPSRSVFSRMALLFRCARRAVASPLLQCISIR